MLGIANPASEDNRTCRTSSRMWQIHWLAADCLNNGNCSTCRSSNASTSRSSLSTSSLSPSSEWLSSWISSSSSDELVVSCAYCNDLGESNIIPDDSIVLLGWLDGSGSSYGNENDLGESYNIPDGSIVLLCWLDEVIAGSGSGSNSNARLRTLPRMSKSSSNPEVSTDRTELLSSVIYKSPGVIANPSSPSNSWST